MQRGCGEWIQQGCGEHLHPDLSIGIGGAKLPPGFRVAPYPCQGGGGDDLGDEAPRRKGVTQLAGAGRWRRALGARQRSPNYG